MKFKKLTIALLMGAMFLTGCNDKDAGAEAQGVKSLTESVVESGESISDTKEDAQSTEGAFVEAIGPVVSDEDFFNKLYETMASMVFFEEMVEFINAEDITGIVEELDGQACVYSATDGFVADYTGTAVGLYPYGEDSYYVYYGEYVDGSREGASKHFSATDQAIYVFEGTWANDKPNGQGSQTQYNRGEDGSYAKTYMASKSGNYVDGIEDGEFSCTFVDLQNYTILMGSYTATDGIAPDLWEQYPQYHERENFKAAHESGKKIFAVCADETGDNIMWLSQLNPEEKLGISGFVD